MGVQVTLQDIQAGFLSASAHTANNTLIEEGFNKALDRTSSTDNAMEVELDVGNHKVLNVKAGSTSLDAVNFAQLIERTEGIGSGTVFRVREPQILATEGQTVITVVSLSLTANNNSTDMYINGVPQVETINYTITEPDTITLIGASLTEDDVIDIYQITAS